MRAITPEEYTQQLMQAGIMTMQRFIFHYRLWFVKYADPLSDDILSDIHQQAYDYAKEASKELDRFDIRNAPGAGSFTGLARH
jgi:hypothetical protein